MLRLRSNKQFHKKFPRAFLTSTYILYTIYMIYYHYYMLQEPIWTIPVQSLMGWWTYTQSLRAASPKCWGEEYSIVQYSTVQYSTRGGADRPGRETLKLILTFVFPLIIYKKWHSVWKLLMLLGNCWQSHDFGKQGVVLLQGCWVYWVQVGRVCSLFCSPHNEGHNYYRWAENGMNGKSWPATYIMDNTQNERMHWS